MTERYFPKLPDDAVQNLRLILRLHRDDPDWLEAALAYYPPKMAQLLTDLLKGEPAVVIQGSMKLDSISEEVEKMFRDLQTTRVRLSSEENAELMSYFRTATSLLEKILSAWERIANMKAMADCSSAVLAVMEDVLTPDQRTSVMERLEGLETISSIQ